MNFRGFLAIVIISAAVVYFLWVAKAGKDQVIEEVKAFGESKLKLTQASMSNIAKEIQTFMAMQGRAPKDIEEVVIEIELSLEGPIRQASSTLEHVNGLVEYLLKRHRCPSVM